MSVDLFVPEIWSARLRRHLDALLVYASPTHTNRDYEGEISQSGDTVHIQQVGAGGTIKTRTKGVDIDAPEYPEGTSISLIVDQDKYYHVAIDDVDRVQVNVPLFERWAERTARNFRVEIDSFVVGKMQAGVDPANVVGTDAVPVNVKADGTGDYTPYKFFVELRRLLNAQDVPEEGRWAVIDEDLEAELLNDDKYIEVAGPETRNGQIGRIAGFTISRTTAVPTSPGSGGAPVPNTKVVAGAGNYATTVAHQLAKLVAYEPEKRFEDALKGLEVYGALVQEGESLALAHVQS